MARSLTAIDPMIRSWYRDYLGAEALASEYIAECGHAMPRPSIGDVMPGTIPARAQPGDVWRSDQHWLVCGDSTDPAIIDTALELADTTGQVSALLWDPLFDCLVPPPAWHGEIPSVFVFTNNHYVGGEIAQWGAPAHVLVWDAGGVNTKHFDRPVRDEPLQSAKLCLWYGVPGSYQPNGDTWDRAVPWGDGRRRGRAELTDTYRLPLAMMPEASRYQKPVDWVRRLIGCLSSDGVVMDPYAGTGTSMVAAQQLDRPSVSIEIDPATADIALARIEAWTGVPAVREATIGESAKRATERVKDTAKRARNQSYARQRFFRKFGDVYLDIDEPADEAS